MNSDFTLLSLLLTAQVFCGQSSYFNCGSSRGEGLRCYTSTPRASPVLRLRGGMRCIVQRVKSASVSVDGEVISRIGKGLMILVGVTLDDTKENAQWMAKKLTSVKFFNSEDQKPWKASVKDIGGEVLLVSQFTLYFRNKGANLDFSRAMPPEDAKVLYQDFVELMRAEMGDGTKVQDGRFGAMMDVALVNDGPVTAQFEYPEPPSQKK